MKKKTHIPDILSTIHVMINKMNINAQEVKTETADIHKSKCFENPNSSPKSDNLGLSENSTV